ncbi:sulfotransferase 1C4-like [Paramormyrops kingsleyae]|uniref:sulfotransferase 1C4-like n=1 Tax=Paramormyrops kingsleyae TaxID=1676925 RepID=UPI000CD64F13|nr:sulfotransferase 1C4-like [Paramormyrops kingsleyae]
MQGQGTDAGGREELVDGVGGVCFVPSVMERWRELQEFQARPDDTLIATFPKAGTSWAIEMVDVVRRGGDISGCLQIPSMMRAPFLELNPPPPFPSGIDILQNQPSPRLIKTHLPFHLLPPSFVDQNCKMVYVARNAKDTAVSYFHFHRMNKKLPEPGDWNQFFDSFLTGQVAWGSWFDHVTGWWKEKNNHRILYLFFEDIKENPAREIAKLSNFLSKKLDREAVDRIIEHTSFKNMKQNPMTNFSLLPANIFDQSVSPFMRKGEVGDWKNMFTVAQNERFEKEYRQLMSDRGPSFRMEL